MKSDYIKEFIVLVDNKNFTKASEKLFITQSALSRHISCIEEELGVVLVERSTHTFSITEIGKEVYKYYKRIFEITNEMNIKIETFKNGLDGHLTIGMLYYSIEKYLKPIVESFSKNFPNIKMDFKSLQPHFLFKDLCEDKIDLGFLFTPENNEVSELEFINLKKTGYIALMSNSHKLSNKNEIHINELIGEKILLFNEDVYSNNVTISSLKLAGFVPSEIIYTEHIDTIPFVLEKTGAIHVTSEDLINTFTTLTGVRISDENLYHYTSLAFKKENKNPAVNIFLSEIKNITNNKKVGTS